MARKTIPISMPMQTIEMRTGKVVEERTATAHLMPARAGTCEHCATKHDPELPHNAQSLFYHMRFHSEHGRYPDWRDAMEHCSDEMRATWTEALTARGVDVAGGKVNRA